MHLQKPFVKKTKKVVSNVKIKENEVVYNGKRKIFHAHKENWLTKQLVEKKLSEILSQNVVLALTESFWSF